MVWQTAGAQFVVRSSASLAKGLAKLRLPLCTCRPAHCQWAHPQTADVLNGDSTTQYGMHQAQFFTVSCSTAGTDTWAMLGCWKPLAHISFFGKGHTMLITADCTVAVCMVHFCHSGVSMLFMA